MNSAAACHEIEGFPGLYVDAFRGKYVEKTRDPSCTFILTHYHGDHYGGLKRDGKYQGPALIHCTPVTAALLITVHQVPSQFVVEHEYGETFQVTIDDATAMCNVTFYDANHCPGAAIVFVQLANDCHLHTGDMRYHEKMKEYPLLKEAAINRKLDLLYLDTTYGHPKHNFVAQDEAVETIASKVHDLLGTERNNNNSTLVLLSCYSIGKEKVLWEASTRTNQLVYVSERKFQMMQCVEKHRDTHVSSQIVQRCTTEVSKTDIHVIPMGMAGELWPFFQPKYRDCAEYAAKLPKQYSKIVAFLPTGWAQGSNWNKKMAISSRGILIDGRAITVEIRLVGYSEHSAFSELCSFVEYLKPRKVVPTVFGDEKDRIKIEGHFRRMIDSTRAKKNFFKSMNAAAKKTESIDKNCRTAQDSASSGNVCDLTVEESGIPVVQERELPTGVTQKKCKIDSVNAPSQALERIVLMGFDVTVAKDALRRNGNDVGRAVNELLSTGCSSVQASDQSPQTYKRKMTPTITDFFSLKKKQTKSSG